MILADPPAMPIFKLNTRGKAHLSRRDLLPPPPRTKKAALHHEMEITDLGSDSPVKLATLLCSPDKNDSLILPNGVHITTVPDEGNCCYTDEDRKIKQSSDANLAHNFQAADAGSVTLSRTRKSKKVLKKDERRNKQTSETADGTTSIIYRTGELNGNALKLHRTPDSECDANVESLQQPVCDVKTKGTGWKGLNTQPSLILTDYQRPNKSNSGPCNDYLVRRMASLNASARVTALLEPEKKSSSKAVRKPVMNGTKETKKIFPVSPTQCQDEEVQSCSDFDDDGIRAESPDSGSLASSIEVIESPSTSYCSNSELEMTAANVLMLYDSVHDSVHDLVHDSAHEMEEEEEDYYCDDKSSFNCYGLLYNGDCMFPYARVFYENDRDFSLPLRIIPKLFPSQEKHVRAAVHQVLQLKSMRKKKKAAKVSLVIQCEAYHYICMNYLSGFINS